MVGAVTDPLGATTGVVGLGATGVNPDNALVGVVGVGVAEVGVGDTTPPPKGDTPKFSYSFE